MLKCIGFGAIFQIIITDTAEAFGWNNGNRKTVVIILEYLWLFSVQNKTKNIKQHSHFFFSVFYLVGTFKVNLIGIWSCSKWYFFKASIPSFSLFCSLRSIKSFFLMGVSMNLFEFLDNKYIEIFIKCQKYWKVLSLLHILFLLWNLYIFGVLSLKTLSWHANKNSTSTPPQQLGMKSEMFLFLVKCWKTNIIVFILEHHVNSYFYKPPPPSPPLSISQVLNSNKKKIGFTFFFELLDTWNLIISRIPYCNKQQK